MSAVTVAQRFTRARPCPVCGGAESDPRGAGRRCAGFVFSHGLALVCTREEYAGALPLVDRFNGFVHALDRPCRCGAEHQDAGPITPAPSRNGPRGRNGHMREVVRYQYRDERGELLFEVVRFETSDSKTFRPRRPDGKWTLDGVRRVLYRLAELQGQEVVFVSEGEKDADRLAALGLAATTNPGGAGKWTDDFAQQLKAAGVRRVVVLADNDEVGRRHAAAVAASCDTWGLVVKVINLPGLPPGGDVSDWLDVGRTRDELLTIERAAAAWTSEAADGAVLRRLDSVKPETVEWLWPGRIARGKLTLVIGDPGLGKSYLALDAAARVSRGGAWPDGGRALAGDVVLLSAEDGLADTIRPRLDALDADVRRIHALTAVRDVGGERGVCLASDLPQLEAVIAATGARLVIVDPLSAYLGSRDSYKDAEIRGLLGPLAAMAERTGVAIVAILHLTKDGQRKALYRALGSIAFVAAARIVLAVAQAPDDENRRLLVGVKNNLAAPAPALAFTVKSGTLDWYAGPVEGIDADPVLSQGASREEREEGRVAEDFLLELLADGDVTAREGEAAARAHGVAPRTLDRARRRLRIHVRRAGFGAKGIWWWSLPKNATAPPKDATPVELASYEQGSEKTDETPHTSP